MELLFALAQSILIGAALLVPAGALSSLVIPPLADALLFAGIFVPAELFAGSPFRFVLTIVSAFCLEFLLLHMRAVKIPKEEILSAKTLGLDRRQIKRSLIRPRMRFSLPLALLAGICRMCLSICPYLALILAAALVVNGILGRKS